MESDRRCASGSTEAPPRNLRIVAQKIRNRSILSAAQTRISEQTELVRQNPLSLYPNSTECRTLLKNSHFSSAQPAPTSTPLTRRRPSRKSTGPKNIARSPLREIPSSDRVALRSRRYG